MRPVFSRSARAVYLDREAAAETLRRLAARLVATDPTVRAVVLFGSLAGGRGGPTSDADLLIVLNSSPHPLRRDRTPALLAGLRGAPLPLHLHAYTVAELERALSEGERLATTAAAGIVLAGALPMQRLPA